MRQKDVQPSVDVRTHDRERLEELARVVLDLCFCVGLALAGVCVIVGMHALVVFKAQTSVFLFLIPNSEIGQFRDTVISGAALLAAATLHMIYQQTCQTNFAMVDWEQSNLILSSHGFEKSSPISCWRSVFVANEFNELSIMRRTTPSLTFLTLVRLSLFC